MRSLVFYVVSGILAVKICCFPLRGTWNACKACLVFYLRGRVGIAIAYSLWRYGGIVFSVIELLKCDHIRET